MPEDRLSCHWHHLLHHPHQHQSSPSSQRQHGEWFSTCFHQDAQYHLPIHVFFPPTQYLCFPISINFAFLRGSGIIIEVIAIQSDLTTLDQVKPPLELQEAKGISIMTNQITLTYNSSCNCKGTHRIAILNDVIDRLLEVNAKARRNKRAHKCPLISLVYDSSTTVR